jgi:hypothetical protein
MSRTIVGNPAIIKMKLIFLLILGHKSCLGGKDDTTSHPGVFPETVFLEKVQTVEFEQ